MIARIEVIRCDSGRETSLVLGQDKGLAGAAQVDARSAQIPDLVRANRSSHAP